MLRKYDLPNQHYNTFFFQSVNFYSVDHFIFVVDQKDWSTSITNVITNATEFKKVFFKAANMYIYILIQQWKKVLI